MTEKCGHRWQAPYIRADGKKDYHWQQCVLAKGHPANIDHRSITRVTKPQEKKA